MRTGRGSSLQKCRKRLVHTLFNFLKKSQKGRETIGFTAFSGGDEEDRTLDLTDANRTLSQLSYAPICRRYFNGKKYYTIKFLIVKSDFFWKTKIFSCQSHKDIVK